MSLRRYLLLSEAVVAASSNVVADRSRLHRTVAVGFMAVAALGVFLSRTVSADMTLALPAGVMATLVICSLVLVSSLFGVLNEFRSTSSGRSYQIISRLPVPQPIACWIVRVPTLAALLAISLVVAPAATEMAYQSTGAHRALCAGAVLGALWGGWAMGTLIAGAGNRWRASSAGAAIVGFGSWCAFSALSGVALRGLAADGVWATWHYLLLWPILVRPLVDGSVLGATVSAVAALMVVAVLLGGVHAVLRRPLPTASRTCRGVRRQWSFRGAPLTKYELVRCWRSKRTRSHVLAALVGVTMLLAAKPFVDLDQQGVFPVAAMLSLMLASFLIAKRGALGAYPPAVRNLAGPDRYVAAMRASDLVVVASTLVLTAAVVGLVLESPAEIGRSAWLVLVSFGVAEAVSSMLLVADDDATGDTVAVAVVMLCVVAVANLPAATHRWEFGLAVAVTGCAWSSIVDWTRIVGVSPDSLLHVDALTRTVSKHHARITSTSHHRTNNNPLIAEGGRS